LLRVKIVDWESDPIVIYWNNGSKSSPDPVTGRWSELPSPDTGTPAGEEAARLVFRTSYESTKQKKRSSNLVGRSALG